MLTQQLALFGSARSGGTGPYCLACITERDLWRSMGQMYYDARRWVAGDPVDLSPAQEAYLAASRPSGGHPHPTWPVRDG